jgi:hypothetical protein
LDTFEAAHIPGADFLDIQSTVIRIDDGGAAGRRG